MNPGVVPAPKLAVLRSLDLSKLRLDGGTQIREEASAEVMLDVLHDTGTGDLWVVDGFHRVLAAIAAGLTRPPRDTKPASQPTARPKPTARPVCPACGAAVAS